MAERASRTPNEWFPDKRNPWIDIYTPSILDEIAVSIGGCTDQELDHLGCSLAEAAELAVIIEEEVTFDMTRTQRIGWIKQNILDPLSILRAALAHQNAPKTSPWPYSRDLDEIDCSHADAFEMAARNLNSQPQERKEQGGRTIVQLHKRIDLPPSRTRRQKILAELEWLEDWARSRHLALMKEKTKPATARRHMFVKAVVRIYREQFPERDQAGIRPHGAETMLGRFVRAAAAPVLGDNNLTAQIKEAVSIVQPNRRPR